MSAAATSLFVTLMFGLYGPIFLVLTLWTFRGVEGDVLRRTDERRTWVRWLLLSSPVSWASTVMIIGIVSVILLTTGEGRSGAWIIAICLVGVAGSWVLMVAVMAVEYMRRWAADGSLAFPGAQARARRLRLRVGADVDDVLLGGRSAHRPGRRDHRRHPLGSRLRLLHGDHRGLRLSAHLAAVRRRPCFR